jgi:hypothetical protein
MMPRESEQSSSPAEVQFMVPKKRRVWPLMGCVVRKEAEWVWVINSVVRRVASTTIKRIKDQVVA